MTSYDRTFSFPIAFAPFSMARIMAEVVSGAGMTMFRTAETEKYPHVTYFFNGGIEAPFAGEERELVPSPKVATYDLQPEMSAHGVTDVLCRAIAGGSYDFTLCNYANCDMVGHTGVLPAVIQAVETVDGCLARVVGRTGPCLSPRHRGPRQLRAHDRSGRGRTPHRSHDESSTFGGGGSRRFASAARRWGIVRRGTYHSVDARPGPTGRDDRTRPPGRRNLKEIT
jgi:hypothetical protein